MGDGDTVGVKFVLTAEEQEIVRSLDITDRKGKGLASTFKDATREINNAEKALSALARSVNFHGSANRGTIASQLVERMTPATAGQIAGASTSRALRASQSTGMLAEVQRLRGRLVGDQDFLARARAMEGSILTGRLAGNAASLKTDRSRLTAFIGKNKLGDTDDEVTRLAARMVRAKLDAVDKALAQGLKEAGGNLDVLKLANAKGVDVASPQAVRTFLRDRATQLQAAEISGARGDTLAEVRGLTEQRRAVLRGRQAKMNRGYTGEGAAPFNATDGAAFSRGVGLLGGGQELVTAEEIAERKRLLDAARGRAGDRRSVIRTGRGRIGRAYTEEGAASYDATDPMVSRGPGLVEGGQEFVSAGEAADRRQRLVRLKAFAAARRSRLRTGTGGIDRGYSTEDITPYSASDDVFSSSDGLLGEVPLDTADEARRVLRRSRLKRVSDLRRQRMGTRFSKGFSAVSNAAGVIGAGILGFENLAGDYTQRVGTEYLDSLGSIEQTFRPLMSISDNSSPGRQQALRGQVIDSALAYGRGTGEVSDALYDIMSSAGNLSEKKQFALNRSSLQLASVTGGDLPVIGKAMTTIQQLYGDKIGSTDRIASMFKGAIDYGKFSATGFANLAPEALSTASLYGISPEDAFATLAVASTRSGRDENMFTGARYLFSGMGAAAKAGLVSGDAPYLTQLRQLKSASSDQLLGVFGREGINVASNTRDMVDEVAKQSATLKGMSGGELGKQQAQLSLDPINALSSLAQGVKSLDDNNLSILLQQGGNGGLDLAGDALKTRLALIGQKQSAPEYLAAGGQTLITNLSAHKDKYAGDAWSSLRAALLKEGDPRSKLLVQQGDLALGQVQLDTPNPGVGAFMPALGWMGIDTSTKTTSSGKDAKAYTDILKSSGLNADEFTAQDYGRMVKFRESGDYKAASSVMDAAHKKGASRRARESYVNPFSVVPPTPASEKPAVAARPKSEKQEDAENTQFIQHQLSYSQKMMASETKAGRVYSADAYRSRYLAISNRLRDLGDDDDGLTATDRRGVADQIRAADAPDAKEDAKAAREATTANTDAMKDLTLALKEIATKMPGGRPTGPADNGKQPPNTSANRQNP